MKKITLTVKPIGYICPKCKRHYKANTIYCPYCNTKVVVKN